MKIVHPSSRYSLATHAKPYSVGSGYRTNPTNCDDPVHGIVLPAWQLNGSRKDTTTPTGIGYHNHVPYHHWIYGVEKQVMHKETTSSTTSSPLDAAGLNHQVVTPWPHMPNLIQLVQGTEQVLPTAMIRYMVVIPGSCPILDGLQ
jgi:hypothetical protein